MKINTVKIWWDLPCESENNQGCQWCPPQNHWRMPCQAVDVAQIIHSLLNQEQLHGIQLLQLQPFGVSMNTKSLGTHVWKSLLKGLQMKRTNFYRLVKDGKSYCVKIEYQDSIFFFFQPFPISAIWSFTPLMPTNLCWISSIDRQREKEREGLWVDQLFAFAG